MAYRSGLEQDYSREVKWIMAKAVVDQDACVGCESCVGACPVSAISVNDGKASVDAGACVECGSCVSTCPVGAISQ